MSPTLAGPAAVRLVQHPDRNRVIRIAERRRAQADSYRNSRRCHGTWVLISTARDAGCETVDAGKPAQVRSASLAGQRDATGTTDTVQPAPRPRASGDGRRRLHVHRTLRDGALLQHDRHPDRRPAAAHHTDSTDLAGVGRGPIVPVLRACAALDATVAGDSGQHQQTVAGATGATIRVRSPAGPGGGRTRRE